MEARPISRAVRLATAVVLLAACGGPTVPPSASPTAVASPTASPLPTQSTVPSPTASPTQSPTATLSPSHSPSPGLISPSPTAPETPKGPTPPPPLATDSPQPTTPVEGIVIDEATIARHLDALQQIAEENGGIRAAGTSGYDESVDYVVAELEQLGFQASRPDAAFTFFDEEAPVTVTVGDESWTGGEWLHAMLYSGEGEVTGVPETVGIRNLQPTQTAGCDPSDWRSFEAGQVALVMGGGCFSRDKVLMAQQFGATALISLVPQWGSGKTLRPTLLDPDAIDLPALVAGQEPSSALLDAAASDTLVTLTVDTEERAVTNQNVIAEWPGASDEVVMLGGHLDSVLDGPGINDNGSGVATLLAMAESISRGTQPSRTIRFGFWAAEEYGTFGSQAYVAGLSAQERDRIQVYVNLDMVGSPNAARYVYETPFASPSSVNAQVTQILLGAFEALGATAAPADLGGGSDHFQFDLVGIPTGGVFSGLAPLSEFEAEMFGGVANAPADPCYHLACDTRANVNTQTATLFGSAVAAVVEDLAY